MTVVVAIVIAVVESTGNTGFMAMAAVAVCLLLAGLQWWRASRKQPLPDLDLSAESLTNQDVINLRHAGLGEGIIFEKIKSTPCTFRLGTADLIALKRAGISDTLISAMLQTTDASPGFIAWLEPPQV
jgi:hypothetical protein